MFALGVFYVARVLVRPRSIAACVMFGYLSCDENVAGTKCAAASARDGRLLSISGFLLVDYGPRGITLTLLEGVAVGMSR